MWFFLPVHELLAESHSPQGWASVWSLWKCLLTLWQLAGASLSGLLPVVDSILCSSQDGTSGQ